MFGKTDKNNNTHNSFLCLTESVFSVHLSSDRDRFAVHYPKLHSAAILYLYIKVLIQLSSAKMRSHRAFKEASCTNKRTPLVHMYISYGTDE